MEQLYSTTTRKKGKHLTLQERTIIQVRLKDGWNAPKIALEIGCSANTVRNEIKRGTLALYTGNVFRYKAKEGQRVYEKNRKNCCRPYDFLTKGAFLHYVMRCFAHNKWSLDACVGYALKEKIFRKEESVCTKTLYNYVDLGLIGIKNLDLPLKVSRAPKKAKMRRNKRILGRSIEQRPVQIEERSEFGHWEADLVIGSRSADDDALLVLIERMTREYLAVRIPGRDPNGVLQALTLLRSEYSEHWNEVFKTITADNGSEFSRLSEIENVSKTKVYFAHPYTSCEKGSIERHNGLLRRFIPKGTRIGSLSDDQIARVWLWCNTLPRKILGYRSPDDLFEEELDKIYACAS